MKIAQVCPYDLDQPGGVQQHVMDLSQSLRNRGHEVIIIAPGSSDANGLQAGDIFLAGKKRRVNFNQTSFDISLARGDDYKNLQQFIKNADIDVIHFHTIWTPFLSWQIFRLSRSRNVASFHDTPPDTWMGRVTKRIFKLVSWFLLPRLDSVIAVSSSPTKHLINPSKQRPVILPPCIDLKPYAHRPQPLPEYVGDLPVIFFLGRLEKRKGIFVLLEAFKSLIANEHPARLLIAGDGDESGKVKQYIENHKLANVTMLGQVSAEVKNRCFSTADIFCAPSLYGESFGIVLAEAMASGVPVVASANSGYRQVLKDVGQKGLFEPGSAQDLYLKLRQLVSDRTLRQELSDWGKQEVQKYDCESLVFRFEAEYKQ